MSVSRATAVLLLPFMLWAGTPGSFRGVLYKGAGTKPGWWYVVGRNDSMRLVCMAGAHVSYGDQVPPDDRRPVAAQSLLVGAEVRVTAEADNRGSWRATEVEILSVKGAGDRASRDPHARR